VLLVLVDFEAVELEVGVEVEVGLEVLA